MDSLAPARRTNPLAVLSLVLGILMSPMALPLGWFATEQIRRSHEGGRRLATVAIVLGWIALTAWLVAGTLFWLWWQSL